MGTKVNLIRKAIKKGDRLKKLESVHKTILQNRKASVKYISIYNTYVSNDFTLEEIDKIHANNKSNLRLLTPSDYVGFALKVMDEKYPNFSSYGWNHKIIRWKNASN